MGTLVLVTLPIGNYLDITVRAKNALKEGEYFLAEDTRVLKEVFNHYGIAFAEKTIDSYHDQSGANKGAKILKWLYEGKDIYLVSDAGSPVISDPAYPLIDKILERGFALKTLPGVNAVTTALELSGLPPHPYTFHGFTPREAEKKKKLFLSLNKGTHLFFEAPTRAEKTLVILAEFLPDLDIAICRELTKTYESIHRFKASEFHKIKDEVVFKGEFVLVLYCSVNSNSSNQALEQVANNYLEKSSPKKLAKLLAEILKVPSSQIYDRLKDKR